MGIDSFALFFFNAPAVTAAACAPRCRGRSTSCAPRHCLCPRGFATATPSSAAGRTTTHGGGSRSTSGASPCPHLRVHGPSRVPPGVPAGEAGVGGGAASLAAAFASGGSGGPVVDGLGNSGRSRTSSGSTREREQGLGSGMAADSGSGMAAGKETHRWRGAAPGKGQRGDEMCRWGQGDTPVGERDHQRGGEEGLKKREKRSFPLQSLSKNLNNYYYIRCGVL